VVLFTGVNIRNYRESDSQQIIEIYQAVFAEPPWNETWTSEQVLEDLDFARLQVAPIVLVAEQESRLVGMIWGYKIPLEKFPFLKGRISPNASYMDEIAVASPMRGKGIAKNLGREFERISREQRTPEIVLRTDERNVASMALFRSLGYNLLGIRDPEFYYRQYFAKNLN